MSWRRALPSSRARGTRPGRTAISASLLLAVMHAKGQGLGPALAASQTGSTWYWLPKELPASSAGVQVQRSLLAPPSVQAVQAPSAATGFWVWVLGVTFLLVLAWIAIRKQARD